jgi:hypothetical protein
MAVVESYFFGQLLSPITPPASKAIPSMLAG